MAHIAGYKATEKASSQMTWQPSQAFCAPCRRGGGGACGVARMKRPTHFVLVESSLFTSVVVSWLHIAVILHYYIMLPRDPMLLVILEKRGGSVGEVTL